jgi:hypothetical protein
MAIYDLKTGSAKLTRSRIRDIQVAAGADESVPVLEVPTFRHNNEKYLVNIDKALRYVNGIICTL